MAVRGEAVPVATFAFLIVGGVFVESGFNHAVFRHGLCVAKAKAVGTANWDPCWRACRFDFSVRHGSLRLHSLVYVWRKGKVSLSQGRLCLASATGTASQIEETAAASEPYVPPTITA